MHLSIIIPTLNEEDYLSLLLESIKKQDFRDYEIIIADAGSKDRTIEIAKSYGSRITSGGLPAKGRNQGAKIAKGSIFLFIDADIISLPPQFLDKILEEFKNRNLDIVSFPIYPVRNPRFSNRVCPQVKIIDKIAYGLYNFWAKLSQNFLAHASEVILVKKEIHQLVKGFDEEIKIAEDHFYARKARGFGKYGFLRTRPILISSRRLEEDGRLKTYLKYIFAGLYMLFLGPVKSDIFKYKFDHYNRK